mmetsp:Transcript_35375/g.105676  ORF Transcript_35375/g.105676 Transcript_35375/m.105676 type:complete len:206 (+) Transcript_35375:208-825(+)
MVLTGQEPSSEEALDSLNDEILDSYDPCWLTVEMLCALFRTLLLLSDSPALSLHSSPDDDDGPPAPLEPFPSSLDPDVSSFCPSSEPEEERLEILDPPLALLPPPLFCPSSELPSSFPWPSSELRLEIFCPPSSELVSFCPSSELPELNSFSSELNDDIFEDASPFFCPSSLELVPKSLQVRDDVRVARLMQKLRPLPAALELDV